MKLINSPLRYPGGKSRAIKQIKQVLPKDFEEYREPFVGGGSVFLYLKQVYPQLKIWINDLNPELYCFWKQAQLDSECLAYEVSKIKNEKSDGRELFNELLNTESNTLTEFERAVRFFVLNRITFSGVVESGGYSQQAFVGRFTTSAVARLAALGTLLEGVKITHLDYSHLLSEGNKNIFTFLDPPYFKATQSKLYGKKGILHTAFNHTDFAVEMKKCKHSWLITYDDCPQIRDNFSWATMYEWELQYGMNNYKQSKAEKGHELFISNYALSADGFNRKSTSQESEQFELWVKS